MLIVEQSFKIHKTVPYIMMLRNVEAAGRLCYKSEPIKDMNEIESAEHFISNIIKSGHESVIEHAFISVIILTNRGISHEIVRHRLASYSQESTRYCNYSKNKFGNQITVVKPVFFPHLPCGEYKDRNFLYSLDAKRLLKIERSAAMLTWIQSMLDIEKDYFRLLKYGCKAEEARDVLPNALKTELTMTCNVREWRHFFKLRASNKAHPQIRDLAKNMLEGFTTLYPVFFKDIFEEMKC